MQGLELSSKVTAPEPFNMGDEAAEMRIAVLDFGIKLSIARCLVDRGCHVRVFPLSTKASEILEYKPDGIMFSNGPGDPAAMHDAIAETRVLVESGIPCFGICLGHQVICLSQGLSTEKMFNGHRGINHPVRNEITGKCEVTSQNHGFVVSEDSIKKASNIRITHRHLNDNTIAGVRLTNKPVFSVQYHPEASAGPHDSRYLFDQFLTTVKEAQKEQIASQQL
jgi:carbamoyl-phosphate synthase small subunit